jgi:hypothetical protein
LKTKFVPKLPKPMPMLTGYMCVLFLFGGGARRAAMSRKGLLKDLKEILMPS